MPFTWKLRKQVQFNFNQDKILPLSDPSADNRHRDSAYVLCANICTEHRQRRRGRFTVPPLDAPTSSNNLSEHKSSVRPEAPWLP